MDRGYGRIIPEFVCKYAIGSGFVMYGDNRCQGKFENAFKKRYILDRSECYNFAKGEWP